MAVPVLGSVPNVAVGATFTDRAALAQAGVHRQVQAGITYATGQAAESVVLSGGYADDVDEGEVILYTGQGGQAANSRQHIADQQLTRGNLALARSADQGFPVRIIRGARLDSPHAPAAGYRYDGLYRVEAYWTEYGADGFLVWRYKMRRLDPEGVAAPLEPVPGGSPRRAATLVQRIVRSTIVAQGVKELHGYRCQVCGETVATAAGPYAEAAHIRPLGAPHDGPDVASNVLCLCPNDHVRFDGGSFSIDDDLTIVDAAGAAMGKLRTLPKHNLDTACLAHHRARHAGA